MTHDPSRIIDPDRRHEARVPMWRVDGRLASIDHKLVGLNRTLLINLLSKDDLSFQAKRMAETELEKNGSSSSRS